jgi:uncharacterized linocin/CFP29 family protein
MPQPRNAVVEAAAAAAVSASPAMFSTLGQALQMNGGNIGGQSVAQLLLNNNMDPQCLRTNATLRKDEWIAFDDTVMEIARDSLVITRRLMSLGLSTRLANPMGHTRLEWQRSTDMTPAELTMSGLSPAQNDRLEFDYQGMPVPIIHKDFNLNVRHLAASRNGGTPIDTLQSAIATRKVSELIEYIVVNGATSLGSNNTLYGLLNAPQRNTGSVTASWVTATGAQIVGDVLEMIGLAEGDKMYGPYGLIIPQAAHINMMNDYKAESDDTILERVMAIPGIQFVLPSTYMTAPNVILFQLSKQVIDIINGFAPMMVTWETNGGMVFNFKVMAIMIPRVRYDTDNNSGIVHYS